MDIVDDRSRDDNYNDNITENVSQALFRLLEWAVTENQFHLHSLATDVNYKTKYESAFHTPRSLTQLSMETIKSDYVERTNAIIYKGKWISKTKAALLYRYFPYVTSLHLPTTIQVDLKFLDYMWPPTHKNYRKSMKLEGYDCTVYYIVSAYQLNEQFNRELTFDDILSVRMFCERCFDKLMQVLHEHPLYVETALYYGKFEYTKVFFKQSTYGLWFENAKIRCSRCSDILYRKSEQCKHSKLEITYEMNNDYRAYINLE